MSAVVITHSDQSPAHAVRTVHRRGEVEFHGEGRLQRRGR